MSSTPPEASGTDTPDIIGRLDAYTLESCCVADVMSIAEGKTTQSLAQLSLARLSSLSLGYNIIPYVDKRDGEMLFQESPSLDEQRKQLCRRIVRLDGEIDVLRINLEKTPDMSDNGKNLIAQVIQAKERARERASREYEALRAIYGDHDLRTIKNELPFRIISDSSGKLRSFFEKFEPEKKFIKLLDGDELKFEKNISKEKPLK